MDCSLESSSTIEPSSLSLKCWHVNTPNCSARRYTRLNSLARSCVEVGIEGGTIVNNLQPHPSQSFVRRHQSDPVLRRRQSFIFEHIFQILKEYVAIVHLDKCHTVFFPAIPRFSSRCSMSSSRALSAASRSLS